jgi:membrane-associated phospholipid phosphatase
VPRLYELIVLLDVTTNTYPSLHASATTLSGYLIFFPLGQFIRNTQLRLLASFWTLRILRSTPTEGQHVFIDMVTGISLELLAAAIALHNSNILFILD